MVALALADGDANLSYDQAMGYNLGMEAARKIAEAAPAFYATHVAPRRATLEGAAGLCCAFWHLIEECHEIALRWPDTTAYGYSWGLVPGTTLRDQLACDSADEWLDEFDVVDPEWLSEFWFWIEEVRPVYHGLGVQGRFGGEMPPPGLLTILLWHLFSQTSLSVNSNPISVFYSLNTTNDDDLLDLGRIRTLPRNAMAHSVIAEMVKDIPEADGLTRPVDLIAYAFGTTRNALANTANDELRIVYDNEDTQLWRWSDIDTIAQTQREAEQIAEAYTAWRYRIEAGGLPALRKVAACAHRCARRVQTDEARLHGTRLITILADSGLGGDEDDEDEEANYTPAWAAWGGYQSGTPGVHAGACRETERPS